MKRLTFNPIFDESTVSVVETSIVIPVFLHRTVRSRDFLYEIASLATLRGVVAQYEDVLSSSCKTRTIVPTRIASGIPQRGVCMMNHSGVDKKQGAIRLRTLLSLQWILINRNLVLHGQYHSPSSQKRKQGQTCQAICQQI